MAWWSWEVEKFYSVKMWSLVSIRDGWESLSNNDLNYLIVCLFQCFTTFTNYIKCLWSENNINYEFLSLFTSRHFLYFPPESRIVYDIYHFMLVSSNSQSLLNQRKGNKENILRITFILKYFLLYMYIQVFSFILKYFLSNSPLNWTFIH